MNIKTDIKIKELKKGDLLFSTMNGEVTFVKIENEKLFPIKIKTDSGEILGFTNEGRYFVDDKLPTLFKQNPFKEPERVVMVGNKTSGLIYPRVLIMIKNGQAVCWDKAETIEQERKETSLFSWINWREVDEVIELTLQDISNGKGVGVDPKLIKIIP